jgi:hypothetical protein
LTNVPAPRASGYAPPTVTDRPQAWDQNEGWDSPTHTVSSAGRSGPTGRSGPKRRPVQPPGIPGWLAVLLLIAVAGVGGLIDIVRGSAVKGGFNIALVVGSIVAIVIVRRTSMFAVVVAPPLVYFVASAVMLYVRSSGLSNRSRMLDSAINWLVYGFPAIAGATAAVLIIAGIRMIAGR